MTEQTSKTQKYLYGCIAIGIVLVVGKLVFYHWDSTISISSQNSSLTKTNSTSPTLASSNNTATSANSTTTIADSTTTPTTPKTTQDPTSPIKTTQGPINGTGQTPPTIPITKLDPARNQILTQAKKLQLLSGQAILSKMYQLNQNPTTSKWILLLPQETQNLHGSNDDATPDPLLIVFPFSWEWNDYNKCNDDMKNLERIDCFASVHITGFDMKHGEVAANLLVLLLRLINAPKITFDWNESSATTRSILDQKLKNLFETVESMHKSKKIIAVFQSTVTEQWQPFIKQLQDHFDYNEAIPLASTNTPSSN
ncbi:hypothetical protein NEHOM01_2231 [Nematocida homosporus]|uniref:uncharacterized protein n=1 Tax=Nematocida homosporus TaxID=1912981 RepID=UPI0022210D66|nr:uncharacterized protein NEHOM01_2231 [Nematocida homosporus]KAI5187508.1 hypothetical protein NEHOM01_2231 [Nematocida homosporus]